MSPSSTASSPRRFAVYAQLFDDTGGGLGGLDLLAATTGLQVSDLAAVALPDGSFVTTATHYDQTTTATSLVAQRYTDSGARSSAMPWCLRISTPRP